MTKATQSRSRYSIREKVRRAIRKISPDLPPPPTETTTPKNARRWVVSCVSETMLMKAGKYTGDQYSFGVEVPGAYLEAVSPKYWTAKSRTAIIDEIEHRSLFKVRLFDRNSVTEKEMLCGPEVFKAYGFRAP